MKLNTFNSGFYSFIFFVILTISCNEKLQTLNFTVSEIGPGWSRTSVNATIFRKNSLVSVGNYQFVAFYDSLANVVLAKRQHGQYDWTLHTTQYKGNVLDAHNVISIMADGDGYLHLSWDHHNNPLNYCKSLAPYSLEMGEPQSMIGNEEQFVSYPEFYRFSNGDLLFAYRDGGSGNGNLVLNRYQMLTNKWERLQTNLIDGEGQRNAYCQICIGHRDQIMVSWVWRETPDVATNHDMCFACSNDGGFTWYNSKNELYHLPISQQNAEIIFPIPQNSNLINQTGMAADADDNIYIATYFRAVDDSCTNFQLLYSENGIWKHSSISQRSLDFNLAGMGSRSIPISRPLVLVSANEKSNEIHVIYRDEEHGNKICLSSAYLENMNWHLQDIGYYSVNRWEPSFDTELWKHKQQLHVFMQNVGQGQAETTIEMKPQMVSVLEIYDLAKH